MTDWLLIAPSQQDAWTRFTEAAAAFVESHSRFGPAGGLRGTRATADALHSALSPEVTGLWFGCHGNPDALIGDDGSKLLAISTSYLTSGRWVYAVACDSGISLGPACVQQGAHVYVGYRFPLGLPEAPVPELLGPVATVVLKVTDALLAGERDPSRLRKTAQDASLSLLNILLDAQERDELTPELANAFDWVLQLANIEIVSLPR